MGELLDLGYSGDWMNDLLAADEIDWPDAFADPIELDPKFYHRKVVNVRGWPKPALWCEVLIATRHGGTIGAGREVCGRTGSQATQRRERAPTGRRERNVPIQTGALLQEPQPAQYPAR